MFALYIHSLPERRVANSTAWGSTGTLRAARLGRIALQKHRKLEFAQPTMVDLPHLRVAGKQHKGSTAGDLEQPPDAVRSLRRELRCARIGQIGGDIEQGLLRIVEMRWQNDLAYISRPGRRFIYSKPPPTARVAE